MNLLPQSDDEYSRDSADYITSFIVFYLRRIGSPQKPEVGNEDQGGVGQVAFAYTTPTG
jgi:hypothetical protein